jgi:type IV secretory pathway VirB10-like protein
VSAEIAKGIRVGKKGQGMQAPEEEVYGGAGFGRGGDSGGRKDDGDGEKVQRTELEKSMLGYSTVKTAKWATRRPDIAEKTEAGVGEGKQGSTSASEAIERVVGSAEKRLAGLKDGVPMANGVGMGGGVGIPGAGPSKGGSELMPAEEQGQSFTAGGVGDMRIGGEVGEEQLVRQGKFLDCVLVNEVRADLMDSPVIGMVSRDFVSLDGQYVLVPAGSKLIGSAGRVQNLQQARVYLRFDRVIFPDQRSAYFPVRRLPAVDGPGSVGIEGDVDRHFMLMFGSAVMLGMLDGLAAAVEGANNSATPTARELIVARSSMNMSQVVAGILARYGNVVPTITVEAGSKMKVFFAEDVRMTPYMRARDLASVKYGR